MIFDRCTPGRRAQVPKAVRIFCASAVLVAYSAFAANNIKPTVPQTKKDLGEELTLPVALAKANRNNTAVLKARLTLEFAELTYKDAWARMYMPSVSLGINSVSAFTATQLTGSAAARDKGTWEHGSPTSGVSLNLGQYTLFNFWRDKDAYDISSLEVERARQIIAEAERQARFDVVNAVFNLKAQQDFLDISQRSVDASQAVYELVKSRIPLQKATRQDLASVEIDLLNAKNTLVGVQTNYNAALWNLNVLLGDPIDHPYNVKAAIKFIKFKMPLDDIVRVFKENSPDVRDKKKLYQQFQLAQKIAEKNSLPLPSVTFSGVSIGNTFNQFGTSLVRTTSSPSAGASGNVDVSASLNFTIPLTGEGGFLRQRALRQAEIGVEQAELDLRFAANNGESTVRSLYTQVVNTEVLVENNERLFQESLRVFESALLRLQTKDSLNRLDIKDAISQLRTSELNFTSSVLTHYNLKTQLAARMGVDRFPEENL